MGVVLTPIITKDTIALDALRGQTLAVDGNGELYQFLALIRLRDGTPLQDSKGRTTSHLSGLFYRTTRLMAEHALKLVFVFDGTPPPRKAREIAKRRAGRTRYEEERAAALARGDLAQAYSKATMTSRLTREMVAEARELLRLMGVPTVQAPSEGEAQAAHMAATSPRHLGRREQGLRLAAVRRAAAGALPDDFRQGVSAEPGHVPADRAGDDRCSSRCSTAGASAARGSSISRSWSAPISTTGIKGIGPKKALKLVQQHGRDRRHARRRSAQALGDPDAVDEVRRIFLNPDVTDAFDVQPAEPDLDGIVAVPVRRARVLAGPRQRRARAHVSRAVALVKPL